MAARPLAGLFLILLGQAAWADELRENEMIVGGGSSESDGLWISGPSIYLRKNTPGLAVGMMKVPGKDRILAFVVVIKGGESRKQLALYDSQSGSSGLAAYSKGFVELANQRAVFAYSLKHDPRGKNPPQEEFSINGTDLEIAKGRVLLVDLASDKPTWKQLRVELPKLAEIPMQTAHVES